METLYRLKGVTDRAEKHLCVDDLEDVKSMIGTECRLSKYPSLVDGKREFILIDGESIHEDFIIIEEIPATIKSDNTQTLTNALEQIEKLEADKAELLEALEKVHEEVSSMPILYIKLKSLIQKHGK